MKKLSCQLQAEWAGRWKENWEQFVGLWILHNSGYDRGCIENAPLWVASYPQIYEWLTKIIWSNGIGYFY